MSQISCFLPCFVKKNRSATYTEITDQKFHFRFLLIPNILWQLAAKCLLTTKKEMDHVKCVYKIFSILTSPNLFPSCSVLIIYCNLIGLCNFTSFFWPIKLRHFNPIFLRRLVQIAFLDFLFGLMFVLHKWKRAKKYFCFFVY